ncbi:MAG: hypothetical protein ACRDRW_10170 [Pseudonocardiaceae bacterium]
MSGLVSIDTLRSADAPRCAELERLLFPDDDPCSERYFLKELLAGHHYLAARADGRLVGYAGLVFEAGPPQAEADAYTMRRLPR